MLNADECSLNWLWRPRSAVWEWAAVQLLLHIDFHHSDISVNPDLLYTWSTVNTSVSLTEDKPKQPLMQYSCHDFGIFGFPAAGSVRAPPHFDGSATSRLFTSPRLVWGCFHGDGSKDSPKSVGDTVRRWPWDVSSKMSWKWKVQTHTSQLIVDRCME